MATNPGIPFRTINANLRAASFIPLKGGGFGMRVINKTGSDIAVNKLVAITGFDVTSGRPKIVLADADVSGHDDVYATKKAIANGAEGTVYKGFLSTATLNTSGVTTVGDAVYLDTTAGAFTATAPTTGISQVIPVGFTTVKSSTVGQVFWNIQSATKLGSNQIQSGADATILQATGTITSANITGTSAGQLGHANGFIMVPAGGAAVMNQLVYAIITNTFSVAAYGGGGNTTVNIGGGGAALTGLAANTVIITNAATVTIEYVPLAATKNTYTLNNPLNLVTASAPTQPGTAAGTISYKVGYRAITIP